MMPNTDSFTGDVMTLLNLKGKDEIIRVTSGVENDALADFLRDNLFVSLYPHVDKMPNFVKQIVARALLDHVDWKHVAHWIRAENN
jgi:hypothetical protein